VGKDWRPATLSPLCGFCGVQDVCELDLLSNATCNIMLYRPGSSMLSPMYFDFELLRDELLSTTVLNM
jgi:hypothetical protein